MKACFLLLLGFIAANAQAVDLIERLRALPPAQRPAGVVTTLDEMVVQIVRDSAGQPFSAHQFLGYSGAGYSDRERYKADFTRKVLEINQATLAHHGPSAKTYYLLGATVDGFGVGYEILQELIASGALKNAVVMGMASDQAIKYHLEGLEKGWGAVISPVQSLVYMKNTYVDSQGNRSWELKSSETDESDTVKVLKDLSRQRPDSLVSFNVFGGGAQAFNETLEMILESRNRPARVQVNLVVGYTPGKPAKDTGYRASDMLAYILYKNQYLLNERIEVSVTSARSGRTVPVSRYYQTAEYRQMAKDMIGMAALPADASEAQIQAQKNYAKILTQLESLPLTELHNFRVRSSRQLAQVRQLLNGGYRDPVQSAIHGGVDFCANCEADSEKLLTDFNRRVCGQKLAEELN